MLLVAVGAYTLAVPTRSVEKTADLRREQVSQRDRRLYALLDGEEIPLRSLNRLLDAPMPSPAPATLPLFIVNLRGRKQGFVVERFLGQQDISVKPSGRPLSAVPGLAGSALLGDGTIAYVLDVLRL